MKKRLRKKKCVAEFAEIGFEVKATYPEMDEAKLDKFMSDVMGKIGALDMYCGGGFFPSEFDLFICTGRVNTGEAARREELLAWLNTVEGIKVCAGELVDANYDVA